MPVALRLRVAVVVVAAGTLLAGLPAATAAAPTTEQPTASASASVGPSQTRRSLPQRLTHLGSSTQVLVVRAANWSTSHASLVAWRQSSDGSWQRAFGPVPARIGWNGFAWAARRVQSSGETPAGTFRLLRGFGLARPAGVRMPYRVVDLKDWWPYDPKDARTYNVFQTSRSRAARWRTSWAEHLATYRRQYRYAMILDYNLPSGVHVDGGQRVATVPADTRKGGGIFLHVNGDGATAGCVSVARPTMRTVLTWLDPTALPRIVMGPASVFDRL